MSHAYSLPVRQGRVCRIAGSIFLFLAACTLIGVASVAIAPGAVFNCKDGPCRWRVEPVRLLDDDERAAVTASSGAVARFDAHATRPLVRAGLGGIGLLRSGPFAVLLLGVSLALRRLGARRGDPLADALPWLRIGSLAAIASAVTAPIGESLTESLLSHGTPEGARWVISLDFNAIGTQLLLAVAAYATVWALEAGLKAQRDLAEIV